MKISIGQYINKNSILHKLDSRSKIISLIILMVSVFLIQSNQNMFYMFIFSLVLILLTNISIFRYIKALIPLMFILTFTFIFQVFFITTGNLVYESNMFVTTSNLILSIFLFLFYMITKKYVKFRFTYFLLLIASLFYIQIYFTSGNILNNYKIRVYDDGLNKTYFVMMRLFIIVSLSQILILTTKPLELNQAIEFILYPFKLLKLPVVELAMVTSLALRFVPTLLDETEKIMKAQASRGVDFSESSLKNKLKQIISLLIPMFVISFKRADDLANAMDSRLYIAGEKRTKLRIYKFFIKDYVSIILVLGVLLTAVYMRVIV